MKGIIVLGIILLLLLLVFGLFFWGKNCVKSAAENQNPEQNEETQHRKKKKKLFTGNNKWTVFQYYKGELVDPEGYEFQLFDFVYGNEKGYNTVVVTGVDGHPMSIGFKAKYDSCQGCIAFRQDDGLVFIKHDHEHKERNRWYEVSYYTPDDQQPKKSNSVIIEDGTVVLITKTNDRSEEWQLRFRETVAEYQKAGVPEEDPIHTISDNEEETLSQLAVDFYHFVCKCFSFFVPKDKKPQEQQNTEEHGGAEE